VPLEPLPVLPGQVVLWDGLENGVQFLSLLVHLVQEVLVVSLGQQVPGLHRLRQALLDRGLVLLNDLLPRLQELLLPGSVLLAHSGARLGDQLGQHAHRLDLALDDFKPPLRVKERELQVKGLVHCGWWLGKAEGKREKEVQSSQSQALR